MPEPEFEITIREPCRDCKSVGVVTNPAFEEWIAAYQEWAARNPLRPAAKFEIERGECPKEEIECGTCVGAGRTSRRVNQRELAELLAPGLRLLGFVSLNMQKLMESPLGQELRREAEEGHAN